MRRWLTFPTAAWAAVAMTFALVSWILYGGYLTDDSYIHFVYARNLANGRGISFNPGEPSYGSTGPLWVIVLAAGTALGWETAAVAQGLGLFFAAGCIVALGLAAHRVGTSRLAQVLPPLALAVDPWFQRWSVSGMEVGLAGLLALVGFCQVFVAQYRRSVLIGGVLLGVGVLTRPEMVLLVALVGATLLLLRRIRDAVQFALGASIPLGVWVPFAYLHFGTIVPNSFVVKVRQIPPGWQSALDAIMILGASSLVPVVLIAFGALTWLLRRRETNVNLANVLPWFIPALWLAGAIFQYSHRGVNVASRYVCPFMPVILLTAGWWINYLRSVLEGDVLSVRRATLIARVLLVAAVLQPMLVGATTWRRVKDSEKSYSENHHAIAEWLDKTIPDSSPIATYDVGIIAYRTERPIIDLAGLTDTLDVRSRRLTLQQKILEHRPEYVVLQGKSEAEFVQRNPTFAAHLQPIFSTVMDWGPGPQAKDVFTIYRGRW